MLRLVASVGLLASQSSLCSALQVVPAMDQAESFLQIDSDTVTDTVTDSDVEVDSEADKHGRRHHHGHHDHDKGLDKLVVGHHHHDHHHVGHGNHHLHKHKEKGMMQGLMAGEVVEQSEIGQHTFFWFIASAALFAQDLILLLANQQPQWSSPLYIATLAGVIVFGLILLCIFCKCICGCCAGGAAMMGSGKGDDH